MSDHNLPPALVEALDKIHTPIIAAYLSQRITSDYRNLMRLKLREHFSTRTALSILTADDVDTSLNDRIESDEEEDGYDYF